MAESPPPQTLPSHSSSAFGRCSQIIGRFDQMFFSAPLRIHRTTAERPRKILFGICTMKSFLCSVPEIVANTTSSQNLFYEEFLKIRTAGYGQNLRFQYPDVSKAFCLFVSNLQVYCCHCFENIQNDQNVQHTGNRNKKPIEI